VSAADRLRGLLLVGLLAAGPLPALEVPEPFTARYAVYANGIRVGDMDRTLHRQEGGRMRLKTKMYAAGLIGLFRDDRIVEQSLWSPAGGTLRPHEYRFRRTGGGRDERESVVFDWEAGSARGHEDGEERTAPLEPGMTDKLSYQVLLRRDLARGMEAMTYRVVEPEETETYRFRVVGRETLRTSLGEFETIKVERDHDSDERQTTFWCAPELDYLMVRIRQDDDGDQILGEIQDWKRVGKAVR